MACGSVPRAPIVYPTGTLPVHLDREPDGLSDCIILEYGIDALSARVRMLRAAEATVDLQYYIWHPDYAGQVMMHEVLMAAERGIKVRIILDGLGAKDCLRHMRKLTVHENIQVVVFNNMGTGLSKAANIFYADTLQRRMHNKLMVIDSRFALTGGRNIGDEYFWSNVDIAFLDMDVLARGAVVAEAQAAFELYWNSPRVKPLDEMYSPMKAKHLADLRDELVTLQAPVPVAERLNAAMEHDALTTMRDEYMGPFRGEMHFFVDHPDKIDYTIQGEERQKLLLDDGLGSFVEPYLPIKYLDIANAYFIPEDDFIDDLKEITESGGHVRVLTNSLMATDVPMVHAAYGSKRRDIVDAGVELWELQAYIIRKVDRFKKQNETLGLHSKFAVLNNDISLIGSANMDPRSRHLNTEVAMVIKNETCAASLIRSMNRMCVQAVSYQVLPKPDSQRKLLWRWTENDEAKEKSREPHRTLWRGFLQNMYYLVVPTALL